MLKKVKKNCKGCNNHCDHSKMILKVSIGKISQKLGRSKVNQHLCSVDGELITLSW